MKVLFDVVHPAHVHFYRYLMESLLSRGDEILVASRHKDVTVPLLDELGFEHTPISQIGPASLLRQGWELVVRDWALLRLARRFHPDLILTRSPAGVQVARLCGAVGVFDTDDGPDVGVHWRAAAPFAHVITTPYGLPDLGPKQRTYRAYKAMAYLHPDRRRAGTPPIRQVLGLGAEEPFSVVRLVAMAASHDHLESGLDPVTIARMVELLELHGQVFISSEGPGSPALRSRRLDVPVSRFHDVLEQALVVVGDSQSVLTEAALLGTPAIHASSYSGRAKQLVELEQDYGLIKSYAPNQEGDILSAIEAVLDHPADESRRRETRARLAADQVDVTAWYLELLDELVGA